MKKILFAIIIISCVANIASAQKKEDTKTKNDTTLIINARTSFGIKAGFAQSSFYGDNLNLLSSNGKTTPLNGFILGITANSMLGKYFWLKHEFGFNQNGANIMLSDSINGEYKSTLKTHNLYLLPICPAFHIKGFQLYAGPYLSGLLAGNILRKDSLGLEFNDNSIFGNDKETSVFNKYLQKFDFGIVAGLEYEFKFGLNIGVRYTQGFVPLLDNANVNTFGQDNPEIKIYNQQWNVSIGYSFNGNKK